MEVICKSCGSQCAPVRHVKGNGWIELVLWLCYFVPGIIYSVWRRTKYETVCGKCESKELIPLDSPMGQKLANRLL